MVEKIGHHLVLIKISLHLAYLGQKMVVSGAKEGQNYVTNDNFKTCPQRPIACGLKTIGLPHILNDTTLIFLLLDSLKSNVVRIAKSTSYQTQNCNSQAWIMMEMDML